jgi:hypothetical protein
VSMIVGSSAAHDTRVDKAWAAGLCRMHTARDADAAFQIRHVSCQSVEFAAKRRLPPFGEIEVFESVESVHSLLRIEQQIRPEIIRPVPKLANMETRFEMIAKIS